MEVYIFKLWARSYVWFSERPMEFQQYFAVQPRAVPAADPRGRTPKPITCEKGPSRAIHSQQLHDFLDFFQNYIGRLWRVLGGIFWCNKMMRPWNLCRFLCGVDLRNLHHSTLMCWFESHICLEFIVGSVFDFFWRFCMSMCRWLSGSRTTYYATWPQHKQVGGSSELKPDYDNVKTVKR